LEGRRGVESEPMQAKSREKEDVWCKHTNPSTLFAAVD
jgi:hypothetical protein